MAGNFTRLKGQCVRMPRTFRVGGLLADRLGVHSKGGESTVWMRARSGQLQARTHAWIAYIVVGGTGLHPGIGQYEQGLSLIHI